MHAVISRTMITAVTVGLVPLPVPGTTQHSIQKI